MDARPRVNFQMKVGAQTTTLTVESAAPVLDTQTAAVGTTVEQAKISQLPYNFLQTLLFTPGVVPGVLGSELNYNSIGPIKVNGLREDMNSFLLDDMSDVLALEVILRDLKLIPGNVDAFVPQELLQSGQADASP